MVRCGGGEGNIAGCVCVCVCRGGYRGGASGALAPPSRKWAGLQCAHAQRHVITIGLYTVGTH